MTGLTDENEDIAAALFDVDRLREQNDAFRKAFGPVDRIDGRVVATPSIAALNETTRSRVIAAVIAYDRFNIEDEFDEHTFGTVTVRDGDSLLTVWWKVDCYDLAYEFGSDEPTDPRRTRRVLTLCLPSEY